MTRLFRDGLPIQVQRAEAGGDPARFRLQGKLLEVDRVWERWTVQTDWWADAGGVDREFWTLTTKEPMLVVIFRDALRDGKWFLSKIYD